MATASRLEFIQSIFGNFFDEWPIGLKILNPQGQILYANASFCRMIGYTEEELQALESEFDILHDADFYQYQKSLDRVVQTGDKYTEIDARHIHKDGHPVWTELSHAIVGKDEPDENVYVLERVVNITDRVAQKGKLLRSERMKTLGQLAGGIAHELNNLLGSISANLEFLDLKAAEHDFMPDAIRDAVAQMRRIVDRGTALTRQLTEFGHAKAGALSLLDVNEVVEETARFVDEVFPADLQVEFELGDDVPQIRASKPQLEQVLMNLYTNAREAMPEGGVLTVETAPRQITEQDSESEDKAPGLYATIRVSDTGVGIEEADIDKLFRPMFTTKEHGTGMGLSIVHGMIRDDNGYIDVESVPGEGTSFTVCLPAATDES